MSTQSAAHEGAAGDRVLALEPKAVLDQAGAENFPVASRILPRRDREHLEAIYGFARLIDDIGDESPGDRLAELAWAEAELDRAFAGGAVHPIFKRAATTARAIGTTRVPFLALIAANRRDQTVTRYLTIADLEDYCALSANPVGRLVLAVFGADSAATRQASDAICTGLQLVEHLQDVGEDYAAGRIYLPTEDLERFGVAEADLGAQSATPALRRLVAFEVARSHGYFHDGAPLVGMLSGTSAIAIAGFIGGGLAQLDAIEAASFDVLAAPVKASHTAVARKAARTLVRRSAA
jgi:squalene synthase HpnC